MWLFAILLFPFIVGAQCLDTSTNCLERRVWENLYFAKKSLEKAKDHINLSRPYYPHLPYFISGDSANILTCETKERGIAFLEIASDLITEAENNYNFCMDLESKPVILPTVKPIDCTEVLQHGSNRSGVYEVWPRIRLLNRTSIKVYCDMETDGGGWTVVQRRGGFSELQNFDENWENYKNGFGDLEEEFWLGNDNIFMISNQGKYEVRFDLEDFEGDTSYAVYNSFWVEDEAAQYKIHISNYTGTAGDGMSYLNGCSFSTKDKINDIANCPIERGTGFWFLECTYVNINGVPNKDAIPNDKKNLYWNKWITDYTCLAKADMKLRRM